MFNNVKLLELKENVNAVGTVFKIGLKTFDGNWVNRLLLKFSVEKLPADDVKFDLYK